MSSPWLLSGKIAIGGAQQQLVDNDKNEMNGALR